MNFGALTMPLGELEPMVRDMLAPSIARDPLEDVDEVIAEAEQGDAQIWLITSEIGQVMGIVVTTIYYGNKGKQVFVRHVAGQNINNWFIFLETIKEWARSEGCATIEYIGRRGFARLDPSFKEIGCIMRADL